MFNVLNDMPELEYLDGQPIRKVSPGRTHASVQKALVRILDDCAGERGESGPEWRFDLGAVDGTDTEFVPDVASIFYERLGALNDQEAEEPPLAPDIAVEVRSPSSRPLHIRRKIERYLKTGAFLVLDADPAQQTITAHAGDGVRVYGASDRFSHESVPWLVFDVGAVFRNRERVRRSSAE